MGLIEKIKNCARNIPEFSEKNYNIVGYVFAALITVAGLFLVYEVITTDALVFKANWNMFKSPLGSLCLFIGFFWAIAWWGKFTHWSATPITKTYDGYGNLKKVEEDYDITNQMFAKFLMPILGHFIIEPIIYGAIIYYPIQCIIAIVGSIFPWIVALIIVGIIVGFWIWNNNSDKDPIKFSVASVLLTICFGVGAYFMWPASASSFNYTPSIERTSTTGTTTSEPGEDDFDYDDSDFD